MPRKPAKKAAKKAAPKGPSYIQMIVAGIEAAKDLTGVSANALEKYITANYPKLNFQKHFFRRALASGCTKEIIAVHHNHKGSYKLFPQKKKTAVVKKPAKKKA